MLKSGRADPKKVGLVFVIPVENFPWSMSQFFPYLSQKRSSGISFLTGCALPALWDLPGLINNFYIIRLACIVVNCFFEWEGRKFISQCRTEGFPV